MDSMRVMMWSNHHLSIEKSKEIKTLKKEYSSIARDVVGEAYFNITGKKLSEKELSRKTFLLFGMMNWIFGWYSPNKHGNSQDLIDDIFNTFVNGLRGEKTDLSRAAKNKIQKVYLENKKTELLSSEVSTSSQGERM
jgi:hypothetical protein